MDLQLETDQSFFELLNSIPDIQPQIQQSEQQIQQEIQPQIHYIQDQSQQQQQQQQQQQIQYLQPITIQQQQYPNLNYNFQNEYAPTSNITTYTLQQPSEIQSTHPMTLNISPHISSSPNVLNNSSQIKWELIKLTDNEWIIRNTSQTNLSVEFPPFINATENIIKQNGKRKLENSEYREINSSDNSDEGNSSSSSSSSSSDTEDEKEKNENLLVKDTKKNDSGSNSSDTEDEKEPETLNKNSKNDSSSSSSSNGSDIEEPNQVLLSSKFAKKPRIELANPSTSQEDKFENEKYKSVVANCVTKPLVVRFKKMDDEEDDDDDDEDEEEEEEIVEEEEKKEEKEEDKQDSDIENLWKNGSLIKKSLPNFKVLKKEVKTITNGKLNVLYFHTIETFGKQKHIFANIDINDELFSNYRTVRHSNIQSTEVHLVLNDKVMYTFEKQMNIDEILYRLFQNKYCTVLISFQSTDVMKSFGFFLFNFLSKSSYYKFFILNMKPKHINYIKRYEEENTMSWLDFYDKKLSLDVGRRNLKKFLRKEFKDFNFDKISVKFGYKNVQSLIPKLYADVSKIFDFQSGNCPSVNEAKDKLTLLKKASAGISQINSKNEAIDSSKLIMPFTNYFINQIKVKEGNFISFIYDIDREAKQSHITLKFDEFCSCNEDILCYVIHSYFHKFLDKGTCRTREKNREDRIVTITDIDGKLSVTQVIYNHHIDINSNIYAMFVKSFIEIFKTKIIKIDNDSLYIRI